MIDLVEKRFAAEGMRETHGRLEKDRKMAVKT
jgi:hypothetical protein